jgi:transposase
MIRTVLTDAQWKKMEPHCLGKKSDPGRTGGDNRLFLEAVLWKARTGCPWRDLPEEFGDWNAVFKRFSYWSGRGIFEKIFEAVSDDPDMEYAMIDATIVPVHRHGHGAKGGLKIMRSASPKAAGQPKSWH